MRQLTTATHGHILTNSHVWSPDSEWLVYDTRSDPAGSTFDGTRIERVHVPTGRIEVLYESGRGAHCGVATYSSASDEIVFILGPENPTPDWEYGPFHRRGVIVKTDRPNIIRSLEACDIVPPFTPGALRGGSHVHLFDATGKWVSFTYEDHVLAVATDLREEQGLAKVGRQRNQRNVGVCCLGHPVNVPKTHSRNHDGEGFSVLVTKTSDQPTPGSDEIQKAYEDAWVGPYGYPRKNSDFIFSQPRSLAFLGDCITRSGTILTELFLVDIPETFDVDEGPLQGSSTERPFRPKDCRQRRLTRTENRKYPGIRGPRHWPRSHPDGTEIAILMADENEIIQIYLVDRKVGAIRQLTNLPQSVESAFTWNASGSHIAFISDGSVMTVETDSGATKRLTSKRNPPPRPEACVFSPDGTQIAYVCSCNTTSGGVWNQLFVVELRG